MRKRLESVFGQSLPRQQRQGFAAELMRVSYWPTMIVGVLVILFELVMIIITLSKPGALTQSYGRTVFFVLYTILLVVTLAAVATGLGARKRLRQNPALFLGMVRGYALVICVWAAFLSAFSHRSEPDVTVYVYVTLLVAVLVPLRLWQAVLVFGLGQAVLLIFIPVFMAAGTDMFPSAMNSLVCTLLAIAIAFMLYRNKVQGYINRATILKQNEEITSINQKLSNLVYMDDLTETRNRRYLEERLPDELDASREMNQSLCVMMMDLDQFKAYNDLYGHQAGDICLQTFAGVVKRCLKDKQGRLVRYGGEEFVVFLPGHDGPAGMKVAESIRQNLKAAGIEHSGSEKGHLTVSIGVCASNPPDQSSLYQLINEADQALYIAKFSGRDRVKLHYAIGGGRV